MPVEPYIAVGQKQWKTVDAVHADYSGLIKRINCNQMNKLIFKNQLYTTVKEAKYRRINIMTLEMAKKWLKEVLSVHFRSILNYFKVTLEQSGDKQFI